MDNQNSRNYADYESFLSADISEEHAETQTADSEVPVYSQEHATVKQRIDTTIDATASKLKDIARTTEQSARGTGAYGPASKVSEQLRRGAGYLESTNVDTVLVKTRDTVRRNPLATIGTAFGIGFLIALVLRK